MPKKSPYIYDEYGNKYVDYRHICGFSPVVGAMAGLITAILRDGTHLVAIDNAIKWLNDTKTMGTKKNISVRKANLRELLKFKAMKLNSEKTHAESV